MFEEEVMVLKHSLLCEVAGSGFVITNAEIIDDILVLTYELSEENWEAVSLAQDVSSSERNIARIISNLDKELVEMFIECGLGIKCVYVSQENKSTLLDVVVQPSKLKEVFDKLGKGEIEPYTLLELTEMEFAKMEIPSRIDEGVWLTDAYIEGNTIYYIYTTEYEVYKSNISEKDIEDAKYSTILNLREAPLIAARKKELIKEDIPFAYIFKDSRGEQWMRLSIRPDEII